MTSPRLVAILIALGVLVSARPASATFHFMQIEQIIAGVDGSTATQAIQLRMRSTGQNLVSQGLLKAWDANGANPVLLIDMTTNVASGTSGRRVLCASANFASATNPSVTPDFILTNPIPDTYLPAGSITFESDFGTIYWRVSWGGAGYTGPTTGSVTNDPDGDFGPPFAGALPSGSGQALRFGGSSSASSTTNLADYAITPDAAVFTNNATASGTIISLVGVPTQHPEGIALGSPIPNPAYGALTWSLSLPRAMRVHADIYDLAGRRIVPLLDGLVPEGRTSYTWDALDPGGGALAPGVYFLAIDAEGTRRSRRFVLLGRGQPMIHPDDL